MFRLLSVILAITFRECRALAPDLSDDFLPSSEENTLLQLKSICPNCLLNGIGQDYNFDTGFQYNRQNALGGYKNFDFDLDFNLRNPNLFDFANRDEIIRKNDLSLYDLENTAKDSGVRIDSNNLLDDSKEEAFVFLNKGRPRYLPLNPLDKPIVKHYPINIDGLHGNPFLPDLQILQNAGLLLEGKGITRKYPYNFNPKLYNYLRSLGLLIGDRGDRGDRGKSSNDYQREFLRRLFCLNKQYAKGRRMSKNSRWANQKNGQRLHSSQNLEKNNHSKRFIDGGRDLVDIICEGDLTENDESFFKNFANDYPRTSVDCGPKKRKENFAAKKTTTTVQGHDYLIEYGEPSLGSIRMRNGDIERDFDDGGRSPHSAYTEISMSYAKPKEEKNYTTVHKGVIQVNQLKTDEHSSQKKNGKIPNQPLSERKIENPSKILENNPNDKPLLDMTDSPIYYIKINKGQRRFKKPKEQRGYPTTTASSNDANVAATSIVHQQTTGPYEQLSEATENRYFETTLENRLPEEQPLTTEEQQIIDNIMTNLEGKGETEDQNAGDINAPSESTSILQNDLTPSENQFYELLTKSNGDYSSSETDLKRHNKRQTKHLEPIAYETYLMEPTHRPKTKPPSTLKKSTKPKEKQNPSKPKRFVQLRALGPNLASLIKKSSDSENVSETSATTTPVSIPTEISTQDNYQQRPDESQIVGSTRSNSLSRQSYNPRGRHSRRRRPKQRKSKNLQDLQIVGSARYDYDNDDPCEDSSEYTNPIKPQRRGRFENDRRQRYKEGNRFDIGLNGGSAVKNDFNGNYQDCSDSVEVEDDSKQFSDSVENVPTPSYPC